MARMSVTHRVYSGVVKRELLLAMRYRAELVQPLVFLFLVLTLFPLGLGPSPVLLAKIGPGIVWIAAILSVLMGLERMFRDDFHDGSLEQLILSGMPLYWVAWAKVLSHWALTFIPLLLLSPLFALLLNLSFDVYLALVLTLLLGTPVLSFIGGIGVALTVGLRRGRAVLPILLLPVFIPLLIFSTSAIESAAIQLTYTPQLAIIAAVLLFTAALAPAAVSHAMKVSQQ